MPRAAGSPTCSLQHFCSTSQSCKRRGHIKLLLQHVLLCPGVLNPRADAEDEPGEAGEMQNSCGSRFLLFTPFPSSSLSPTHMLRISPAETDGYRQEFVFDAVACCKCCTVLFLLFFNQQIVIYAYARKKKKTKTNKLYQNCPEWFGCFVTLFAVGNDAQLVDRQSYSCSSSSMQFYGKSLFLSLMY